MSKFKVGDRIVRISKPAMSAPYGYVSEVTYDYEYLNARGLYKLVDEKLWQLEERHKHHDLIIAWAKGAEIEFYSETFYGWLATDTPYWNPDSKYRIAPPTPQTDAERIAELEARVKELEDNQ
jgi:starvation-inducible outer membrane lipoprotein